MKQSPFGSWILGLAQDEKLESCTVHFATCCVYRQFSVIVVILTIIQYKTRLMRLGLSNFQDWDQNQDKK